LVSRHRTMSTTPIVERRVLPTKTTASSDHSVGHASVSIEWSSSDLECDKQVNAKAQCSKAQTASSSSSFDSSKLSCSSSSQYNHRCDKISIVTTKDHLTLPDSADSFEEPVINGTDITKDEVEYHDREDEVVPPSKEVLECNSNDDSASTQSGSLGQAGDKYRDEAPGVEEMKEDSTLYPLSTSTSMENQKLALVKRVSSVGHASCKMEFLFAYPYMENAPYFAAKLTTSVFCSVKVGEFADHDTSSPEQF